MLRPTLNNLQKEGRNEQCKSAFNTPSITNLSKSPESRLFSLNSTTETNSDKIDNAEIGRVNYINTNKNSDVYSEKTLRLPGSFKSNSAEYSMPLVSRGLTSQIQPRGHGLSLTRRNSAFERVLPKSSKRNSQNMGMTKNSLITPGGILPQFSSCLRQNQESNRMRRVECNNQEFEECKEMPIEKVRKPEVNSQINPIILDDESLPSQKSLIDGKQLPDEENCIKDPTDFLGVPKIFRTEQVVKKSQGKKKSSKTTEYYYLLQRKTFRMMKKYYKEQFEDYSQKYKFKRKIKEISRKRCDQYFAEYIEEAPIFDLKSILPSNPEQNSKPDKIGRIEEIIGTGIVEPLQLLILCDRYKKSEKATHGMNFTQQRNLLNHYNQKNLHAFLSSPANCLMTALYLKRACFVESVSPIKHMENECLKQKDVDPEKLLKEMKYLYQASVEKLPGGIDLNSLNVTK